MYATILLNRRPGENKDDNTHIKLKKNLEGSYFIATEFIHQMLHDHKMFLQLKLRGLQGVGNTC